MAIRGHVVLAEMSSCWTLGHIVVELLGTDGQNFPTGPLIYMWFVFFLKEAVYMIQALISTALS